VAVLGLPEPLGGRVGVQVYECTERMHVHAYVCVYRDGCRRLPVRVPLPAALGCGQGQGDDCRHNTTHNLRYTK